MITGAKHKNVTSWSRSYKITDKQILSGVRVDSIFTDSANGVKAPTLTPHPQIKSTNMAINYTDERNTMKLKCTRKSYNLAMYRNRTRDVYFVCSGSDSWVSFLIEASKYKHHLSKHIDASSWIKIVLFFLERKFTDWTREQLFRFSAMRKLKKWNILKLRWLGNNTEKDTFS